MQFHLFYLFYFFIVKHYYIRDAFNNFRVNIILIFENVLQIIKAIVKKDLLSYEFDLIKYENNEFHLSNENE